MCKLIFHHCRRQRVEVGGEVRFGDGIPPTESRGRAPVVVATMTPYSIRKVNYQIYAAENSFTDTYHFFLEAKNYVRTIRSL